MKLLYIWDAYCGWCYGFDKILRQFVDKHPELSVQVISVGLFNQNKSIGEYTHIADANERISEYYGVVFGQDYKELLNKGELILNSNDAAKGYGILKELIPSNKWVELAGKLQESFYINGQSLSDVRTYTKLAKEFNVDTALVAQSFVEQINNQELHSDILLVRKMQIKSYSMLIVEKEMDNIMTCVAMQ
ncbi:hypothetical protein HZY83_04955 [Gemella sp. GH3]|uniref:hypothetical protein n=1 Tax=unclassified Gemella TaxID=2624949 RepID=UPI0015CFD8B8|nr:MULTISPECIES: hypothetical protein [unclassified Gemella]MBF0714029.1 hypothetical protein [Gemella sp. GH3.1]NYS50981.1 hypothetical protein [Gemella sp. GH3]